MWTRAPARTSMMCYGIQPKSAREGMRPGAAASHLFPLPEILNGTVTRELLDRCPGVFDAQHTTAGERHGLVQNGNRHGLVNTKNIPSDQEGYLLRRRRTGEPPHSPPRKDTVSRGKDRSAWCTKARLARRAAATISCVLESVLPGCAVPATPLLWIPFGSNPGTVSASEFVACHRGRGGTCWVRRRCWPVPARAPRGPPLGRPRGRCRADGTQAVRRPLRAVRSPGRRGAGPPRRCCCCRAAAAG
jgi:hypothetical protein